MHKSKQVREPTAAMFSAETMLRGMGVELPWSLAAPLTSGAAAAAAGGDPAAAAGGEAAAASGDVEAADSPQAALLQVCARCAVSTYCRLQLLLY